MKRLGLRVCALQNFEMEAVIAPLKLEEQAGHPEMQLVRGHHMETSLKETRTLYPGCSQCYWTQAEHQLLDQAVQKDPSKNCSVPTQESHICSSTLLLSRLGEERFECCHCHPFSFPHHTLSAGKEVLCPRK